MSNPYYTPTGNPATQARGTSANMRNEFDAVAVGFDDVYAEILALAAAIGVAVTVSEVPLASASTTDIGNGYGPVLLITGSSPINSFGANYKGAIFLRFQGSLQINHSSTLQCPGGINITTQADDACIAVPIGDPANGWRIMAYCRVSQGIIDDIAVKTSSTYADPSWLTSLDWAKITGKPTTLAGYGITDAPQKDGTGATGTWGINITGSAAQVIAAITASGLTIATGKIAGRTTASTGAIEEIGVNPSLNLAGGLLSATLLPIRQTVLSGPVDSNGYADFGGSTGSGTLTTSGTIVATTANGFSGDRVGSIVNPAFTSPAGSGTGYLYLDIAADGTCTAGVSTLLPNYQFGGTYSTTNGQFTFNEQEMTGKVGNGSAAVQTHRVYIGECAHTSGSWSGTPTWYALMGRYESTASGLTFGSNTSYNHNIGTSLVSVDGLLVCTTTEIGYSVGEEAHNWGATVASNYGATLTNTGRNSAVFSINSGGPLLTNRSTFVTSNITAANWSKKVIVRRRF